jgi:cephalosporin hydroxylase
MGMTGKTWFVAATACVLGAIAGFGLASHRASRPDRVVAAYHRLFHKYGDSTYQNTRWLGVRAQKCPLDMWVFQEILYETRPDVLVEMGTFQGGSALYFASVFDLLGHGRVVTVDIEDQPEKPRHERITYLLGSSTSDEIAQKVAGLIKSGERVMVVLDSDHHRDHVLREMRRYASLVSPGCYLIVEDTHFNGHPILPKFGPGPMEAVQEFLKERTDFIPDRSREKFLMTFNPSGYLKRVR